MKLKKRMSTFFKSEKASISRKQLLTAAVSAGLVFVLSQSASACTPYSIYNHANSIAVGGDANVATSSHYNHTNHASHCSY